MTSEAAHDLMLIGLLVFIVAGAWCFGVGMVLEARLLARKRALDRLSADVEMAISEHRSIEESYQTLRTRLDAVRRDVAAARRRIADLLKDRHVIVHTIGRPAEGRRCFVYEIAHDGRGTPTAARPIIDPRFWTQRSVVEIWAEDEKTAARQIGLTFDSRSGFRRSALIEERAHGV